MYDHLIKYYNSFNLEKTPEEIISKAKLLILDSLGLMLNAQNSTKLQHLYTHHDEEPTILFKSFIDGTLLVSNELDEGNVLAKGHPACHFTPALINLAIHHNVSTKNLLEAFIVGYEISARIGEIIQLKPGIHPHANWGMIGGAFAIAKLFQWKEQSKILNAVFLASQFAFPTLWDSVFEGKEVRNLLIGFNNLTLSLLSKIIEAGYEGSDKSIEILYKDILGTKFDIEKFNTDFSYNYLEMSYFKIYDFCRFCHGPIDGILKILQDNQNLKLSDIKRIDVYTYRSAAILDSQYCENEFAGKFSIPYAISKTILLNKRINVAHDLINQFSKNVHVHDSEEFNLLLPKIRATKIRLTTHKGIELESELSTALGDGNTDNLDKLVIDKFESNASTIFSNIEVSFLKDFILNLHRENNMSDLEFLLRRETNGMGC
ncbi:MmgE/PrpD family protein [Ureibacillus aquaedulcis]|uniref:MmgE/PrpD family protein n=1 Tax=Ureibacillus aquaedulcis TaxID=3058421 RepID=A0ABT8GM43_9BACL|nr:MmgE/PrpD family protein [Ureibacillus sp. BA0131]MDN4491981.1 MmgE/PrpD family protein [Ureibacillus sp. BA0131]